MDRDGQNRIVDYYRILNPNSDSNNLNRILPDIHYESEAIRILFPDWKTMLRAVRSVLIADSDISNPDPEGLSFSMRSRRVAMLAALTYMRKEKYPTH